MLLRCVALAATCVILRGWGITCGVALAASTTTAHQGIAIVGNVQNSPVNNIVNNQFIQYIILQETSSYRRISESDQIRKLVPSIPADAARAIAGSNRPEIDRLIILYNEKREFAIEAELRLARAKLLMAHNREQAIRDFERAYALEDGQPRYALAYSDALIQDSKYSEAAQICEQLVTDSTRGKFVGDTGLIRVTALVARANTEMLTFRIDDALDTNRMALDTLRQLPQERLEVSRSRVDAEAQRAALLSMVGRFEEAGRLIDDIFKIFDRQPALADAEYRVGLMLGRALIDLDTGKHTDARTHLSELESILRHPTPFVLATPVLATVLTMQAQLDVHTDIGLASRKASEAAALSDSLAASSSPTTIDFIPGIMAYGVLAYAKDLQGDEAAAADAMDRRLARTRQLVAAHSDQRLALAVSLEEAAGFQRSHGNLERAATLAAEAISNAREATATKAFARRFLELWSEFGDGMTG